MTTTSSSAPSGDDRLRILYGDPALAPPERTPLRAGPLTLVYTALGDLRYIRYGRHEIVRRLYHAVRNENWGTVIPEITVVEREIGEDSFRIVYDSRHTDSDRGIDLRARVTLTGGSDGTIVYDFDGEALSTFRRNRIGICVLHPAQDCKARMLHVKHTDGSVEEGAFPDLISPHQPFFDIAELSHAIGDTGAQATITFAGDVFEMEDQRNWLDASYKTYSTPLALPMPAEVPAGTRIRQTVTLSLADVSDVHPTVEEGPVVCQIPSMGVRGPYQFSIKLPQDRELTDEDVKQLGRYYIFPYTELDLSRSDWQQTLESARAICEPLGAILDEPDQPYTYLLSVAVRHAELLPDDLPLQDQIPYWTLLSASSEALERAREVLRDKGKLVIGSASNFTELNRQRPKPGTVGGVAFAGNPQVHAFDSLSIMETPPMIAEAIRTAQAFLDERFPHIAVGPLTLYGPHRDEDQRQKGLFAAAWYMAALGYAASSGAYDVTLCEAVGERGLFDHAGTAYPVMYALGAVQQMGDSVKPVTVSHPLRIASFHIHWASGTYETFLVNLTPDEQQVVVRGLHMVPTTLSMLDETNALTGFSEPRPVTVTDGEMSITLPAYAIAKIVSSFRVTQPAQDVAEGEKQDA